MKIAVVGCGAVGGFYGAKLARAGQEVHFLLRSDFAAVRRRGVRIESSQGNFVVRPKCAQSAEVIGLSDIVLVALKTTGNDQFPTLIPPLVGPKTAILTLQNGLGNEAQLARLFPPHQILGGLCFVCLNRIEPGVILHIDHGMVVLGEYQRWPEPRTHDIASMFRTAGVPCKVTDSLERAHWEKLLWNIPFNGLGVASAAGYDTVVNGANVGTIESCMTTDRLLDGAKWERLVWELMQEVLDTAHQLGFEIPEALAEKQISNTRTMGAYKPSTVLDFEHFRRLELEALFEEPLRQAELAGVTAPRLAALCHVLRQLDHRTQAEPLAMRPGAAIT